MRSMDYVAVKMFCKQLASVVIKFILRQLTQATDEANSLALLVSVGYKPLPPTVKDKCLI